MQHQQLLNKYHYEPINRKLLQIGDQQYPIQQSILLLLLLLSLIFNTYLFNRGHSTYSIKYQLMKKQKIFRIFQPLTMFIEYLYKSFFILPFLLLIAINVLRGLKSGANQVIPIFINGLIVIVIIYPTLRQYYYTKYLVIWILVLSSQLLTQFLQDSNPYNKSRFIEISTIFYTANSMIFCLALLFNQKTYWEIGTAVQTVGEKQIKQINQDWIKNQRNNLSFLFDGGLYGWMCKNQHAFKYFLGLYFLSLLILGIYAFLIYHFQNSYLGIAGLVTSIVYDIFILTFSSLKSKQRSIINIFIMIFVGRLLTFVFGKNYWIFGHCLLYLLVGVFIGSLIIDKQWPSKARRQKNNKIKLNALRTPQFVLFILTLEIVILILVQQFTQISEQNIGQLDIQQFDNNIPVWQFAIIIVIFTWVIILYKASIRMMSRHINKIRTLIQYYFGFTSISQYHIYILFTYNLIVGGGFYCLFYLHQQNVFLGCIFLPVIYMFIFGIGISWVKNDYAILADINDYNIREFKIFQGKLRKKALLEQKLYKQREIKRLKHTQYSMPQGSNFMNMKGTLTGSGFNPLMLQTNNINFSILQTKKIKVIKQTQSQELDEKKSQQSSTKILNKKEESVHKKKNKKKNNKQSNKNQKHKKIQNQNTAHHYQGQFTNINLFGFHKDQIKQQYQHQNHQNKNRQDIFKVQQFVELKNWRQIQMGYFEIWQNLTKYDKRILISLLGTIIMFITYSLISYLWIGNVTGLAFSISILSFLTSFIYYKHTKTSDSHSPELELAVSIIGFIIGIIFWAVLYKIEIGAILYSLVQIILYGLNLQQGIKKHIPKNFIVSLSIKIGLLAIFICIIIWVNYGIFEGIFCLLIMIIITLGLINVYYIKKNGNSPKILQIGSIIIISGIIVALAIIGFVVDVISNFTVFTILMYFIILAFFIVSSIIMFHKNQNRFLQPLVYSSYGTTIYKFDSEKQKLVSSSTQLIYFQISMILLIIYSAITTLFFKQKYFSIYSLSIFLIVKFTQLILRTMKTYYQLGQKKKYITKQILLNSLNRLKHKYMPNQIQGQDSPYFIENFQKTKAKAQQAQTQKDLDELWKKTLQFKQQIYINVQEQQKFLFFWIALIQFNLYAQRKQQMIDYLILMQQIKDQLKEYGILLESILSADSVQRKYQIVQKQINSLNAVDYLTVQQLYQRQYVKNKKRKAQLHQLHIQNQAKIKERQQEIFRNNKEEEISIINPIKNTSIINGKNTLKQSQINIKNSILTQNIGNPIQEFKKLLENQTQFQDKQFLPNDDFLGDMSSIVKGWRRPRKNQKFISDSISANDVKQGKIGDCYLISSFAVLNQNFIKRSLGFDKQGNKLWNNQKGAYMIKFYKFLRQKYVIVDDNLPIDSNGQWIFARSQQKDQFWPGIIQKAYAKLYKGYHNIVSGKCHQVLAEFTGGFPFEILINDYKLNSNALWVKLINSKTKGYLLAAGSPQNAQGDSAFSKRGIVQGHAYSILDVKQIENDYKLIKLKNPHGSQGRQWIGQFSDQHQTMTKRMRSLLNHQKKNDGIFWMKLQDFISQFKSLYICCIFESQQNDQIKWKKFGPIRGKWQQNKNSFGRAQNAQHPQKNIQFGLTVTKKCTMFLNLNQQNLTALTGKNYISFKVQKNQGKRITKGDNISEKLVNAPMKPTDLVSISQQIQLQNSSYPYTFSIYLASETTQKKGGDGIFMLQIFCNDTQSHLINHQDFHLQKE